MNKIVLFALIFVSISMMGQERWRRLNVGTSTGVSPSKEVVVTYSTNLYYELNNSYYLQVWNSILNRPSSTWVGSKVVIVKKHEGFSLESGIRFENTKRSRKQKLYANMNKNLFFIVGLNYQFKLN